MGLHSLHSRPHKPSMTQSSRATPVQEIAVTYFQGDMPGWIHINLHVARQTQRIWATSLFPPFDSLMVFLEAVLFGPLPAQFAVDEEGRWKVFQALTGERDDTFYFRLVEPEAYSEELDDIAEIFLAGEFKRGQFVTAFAQALLRFIQRDFNERYWPRETLPSLAQLNVLANRALVR